MSARVPPGPAPLTRRERLVFSLGMLVAGATTLVGAWQVIVRHGGYPLTILPAALMPVWAALFARRAARRRP